MIFLYCFSMLLSINGHIGYISGNSFTNKMRSKIFSLNAIATLSPNNWNPTSWISFILSLKRLVTTKRFRIFISDVSSPICFALRQTHPILYLQIVRHIGFHLPTRLPYVLETNVVKPFFLMLLLLAFSIHFSFAKIIIFFKSSSRHQKQKNKFLHIQKKIYFCTT